MIAPDPALAIAARALPDPKTLSASERRALEAALRLHLSEVRGGFRAGDIKVSRKTAIKLEARGLVRKVLERNRYTLICTGAGKNVFDIIDERKARKGN
jgi:phosphoserine phosphatase